MGSPCASAREKLNTATAAQCSRKKYIYPCQERNRDYGNRKEKANGGKGDMEEMLLNQLIRLQLTAASTDEEQLNRNTELRDRQRQVETARTSGNKHRERQGNPLPSTSYLGGLGETTLNL